MTVSDPCSSSGGERRVVFLLLPQLILLDLAGPAQVFQMARRHGAPYRLLFCASQPELPTALGLAFTHLQPLVAAQADDLIIIPGFPPGYDPSKDAQVGSDISQWLSQAHAAGAHLASVCTGAFVLGEAGLLDGRRCTTHWMAVSRLQARYPRAHVQDGSLFVHDGKVSTSAGIASGIDMALSLLEQQQGPLFTAQVARTLVVYLRRNGSEPQESVYLQYRTHLNPSVHLVQDYLIGHISEAISLPVLAQIAHLSTRSLARVFKGATGITPVQYHQRLQLELAATLLNDPALSIEAIAGKCGFEDARHFRRLWRRQFGTPPSVSRASRLPVASTTI
jgi:transcriptional regulator GlxA family with amidase domain